MARAPDPLAPELTLLAAIERAELHSPRSGGQRAAYRRDVVVHLGLDWHPGTARRLKAQLEGLETDRCVRLGSKAPDRSLVALTRRGCNRLQRARREQMPEALASALPESPQHRAWREARAAAVSRVDEFRSAATDAVQDAETALVSPAGASAEELMRIGDRLRREFWRLASATYCREEWAEPDERKRDKDPGRDGIWLCSPRAVSFWAEEKLLEGGLI